MAKLTKAEKAWVVKMNKLLAECPSTRIGFATIGDCDVNLFDVTRYSEICDHAHHEHCEFIQAAQRTGASFDEYLNFPNQVESTAG